jgi:hypothetical protein
MGQLAVTARLVGVALALMGVFWLYRLTLATRRPVTVFQAVYTHSIIILVSLVYYCIGKFCYSACHPPVPPRKRRPLEAQTSHIDLQRLSMPCSETTQVVMGVPKLTIQNVWILVYGLGFVFFITGYCFLGIHPACLACAGLAMWVLSVDELICPKAPFQQYYLIMRYTILLVSFVSLVLVTVDLFSDSVVEEYVGSLDLYSIFFGLFIPICCQYLMILVRDSSQHCTLGTVFEACEFGFPFTVFLGVFHFCVAYGQRLQTHADDTHMRQDYLLDAGNLNATLGPDFYYWYHANVTAMGVMRTDGPSVLFFSISPLLLAPVIVSYVSSVLDGCTVDPLLSLTLALTVERLILSPGGSVSALNIYGAVCCSVAILLRILGEYKPKLMDRNAFSLQEESTHLTERAIRERDRRVQEEALEVEELTREFE